MSREARKSSPVSTYYFNIKAQRVLIAIAHLMCDCRYLNLVRWYSRSIKIRQRDGHAFGNGKDGIAIYKYFIAGEEILISNLMEGLSSTCLRTGQIHSPTVPDKSSILPGLYYRLSPFGGVPTTI